MNTTLAKWLGGTMATLALALATHGASISWDVGSGDWDIATTANWAGDSTVYNDGDDVAFNQASAGPRTITVTEAVEPGSMAVASSQQYNFNGTGTIANTTVTKSDTGEMSLLTDVFGGGVDLTLTAGNFRISGIDVGGTAVASLSGTGGTIYYAGKTLTVGAGNTDTTYTGAFNGGGTLTKVGNGVLTLFDASSATFAGSLTVSGGTVRLGAAKLQTSSAPRVNDGGTLDLNGFNQTLVSVTLEGGSTIMGNGGLLTLSQASRPFSGISGGTGTVAQVTGDVHFSSASQILLDIRTNSGGNGITQIFDGVISGASGGLGSTGNTAGTAVLRLAGSASNTFTGPFSFDRATIELAKTGGATAIPTDVTFSNGGTLKWLAPEQIADTATLTIASGNLNLNGFTETVARLASPGTGAFQPDSAGTLILTASSGDVISIGTGLNITKKVGLDIEMTGSGGGILFTAAVDQNRVMQIGTDTVGQRTLDLGSPVRTVTVAGTSSSGNLPSGIEARITSQITGMGGIIKDGIGDLQLLAANTFSGDTRVDAGTLILSHNLALQNSAFDSSGAGSLVFATGINTPTFGGLKGGGNLVLPGTTTSLTLNPGLAASHDFTGNLSGGSATLQLTKSGAGTQILSGSNTYGGATNLNAGILQANHASALGSGNIVFGGGTLQYSAASAGQDWAARFKNSASSVRLDTNGQTVTLGAIDATNSGGLTKLGGGTLVLAGVNAYTGTTTVEAGTLLINGSTAAASPVVVSGGILGGSGIALGSITVNSGGTLAAGNSIGSLGSGALAMNDGSTFAYELNSSVLAGDLLYVDGGVTLTGEVTLTLAELASGKLVVGDKLTLIASTEAWNGGLFTYLGSPLADDSIFTLGSNKWQFNYNDTLGGSNFAADQDGMSYFITMTAIPEPSAGLLLALAGLVALRRRR